ncbi:MAG: hypothetical protein RML72_01595 [Bacteroidia bacterium]|nr:hypothetical protein [Bacteroidia bacterium]MDW8157553.1 hypothetical protein [Bacteroidia bacterium]
MSTTSLFRKYLLEQSDFSSSQEPVITLCYQTIPFWESDYLQSNWLELFSLPAAANSLQINEESNWKKHSTLLISLAWQEHRVDIIGLKAPLPDHTFQQCVQATGWNESFKQALSQTLCYINLAYSGYSKDPIQKYLFLYQIASTFPREHLIGIINEPAFHCHPPEAIEDIIDEKMLDIVHHTPPLIYWCGFLRAILAKQQWLLTRGHHLFGIPDFALAFYPGVDPILVHHIFQDIFLYMYFENKDIQPGDDIALSQELTFRVVAPNFEQEPLKGAGQLFIFEPWNFQSLCFI